jgi:hypothetical protein
MGLLTSLHVTAAAAQQSSSCDTTTTATLLKRLGEAVDGYRTGRQVWVSASFATIPEVVGVFNSQEEAAHAVSGRVCFHVFGPYLARPDSGGSHEMMFLSGPIHFPDSRYPFDSLGQAVPLDSVVSITVTTHLKKGPDIVRTYPAWAVDALFFTMPAVDKFVLPYYERLYGAAYAATLRQRSLRVFGY